jgi:4'-phosphopantetheinyl transferase
MLIVIKKNECINAGTFGTSKGYCWEMQISNSEITFEYNSFGKPYLKGSSGFHFNIAHSGDWVIAGMDTMPLGIDVEQVCENEYMDIAERFFTEKECRWLLDRHDSERLDSFYVLWTLKESYVKMLGKGLSIPLNSFSVIPDINGTARVIDINDSTAAAYLRYMKIDRKHYISVCSEREHEDVNVNVVSCKDMLI